MRGGWRDPRRWARTGRWLVVPYAVLVWFTLVPGPVTVAGFVLAVVGLLGVGAAVVVAMLRRGRAATGVLGVVLLLAGLALFGLDPFPGSVPGLGEWWPSAITQPQAVGSGYWTVLALGVVLTGVGLLATLLVTAVVGGGSPERRSGR